MPALPLTPVVRRTQEERRTATRGALLDATIAVLVELGYSNTTTLEVERRAGCSRGARIHHFSNKAALLAGAADHLYEQLSDFYAEAFGGATLQHATDLDRARHGLRELWRIYQGPHFTAALELNMAARTDRDLATRLYSVALRHRQLALDALEQYFPVLEQSEARALIELVHAAFLGMRMQIGVVADPESIEITLAALEASAARYFTTSRC